MKIILFGPQGAGKGVIGEFLSKKLNIPLLGAGQILRDAIKEGSSVGKIAEKYINEGNLVPPKVMSDVMRERVSKKDCKKGFIIEGFPRNLEQDRFFPVADEADLLIELTAPRELLIRRLAGRRLCRKCGAVYNIDPECAPHPKVKGKCDKCGGELYQRDDDKKEAILKRLQIYDNETIPILKKHKNKVHVIDTTGTPDENFKRVMEIVGK